MDSKKALASHLLSRLANAECFMASSIQSAESYCKYTPLVQSHIYSNDPRIFSNNLEKMPFT